MSSRIAPEIKQEIIVKVVFQGENPQDTADLYGVSASHLYKICREAKHAVEYSLGFYGRFPKEYRRYSKNKTHASCVKALAGIDAYLQSAQMTA